MDLHRVTGDHDQPPSDYDYRPLNNTIDHGIKN